MQHTPLTYSEDERGSAPVWEPGPGLVLSGIISTFQVQGQSQEQLIPQHLLYVKGR